MLRSEASVFTWVRSHLRAIDPTMRFDRMEHVLVAGVPDVNYCALASEGWLELKAGVEPKRIGSALLTNNHPLSPDQANFLLRQARAGGRGGVLIGTDKRLMVLDGETVGVEGVAINRWPVARMIEHAVFCRTRTEMKKESSWMELYRTLMDSSLKGFHSVISLKHFAGPEGVLTTASTASRAQGRRSY